jgi:hypothetical protein
MGSLLRRKSLSNSALFRKDHGPVAEACPSSAMLLPRESMLKKSSIPLDECLLGVPHRERFQYTEGRR